MHVIITVQSLRPILPDKKTWNEINLNNKSIFCCLDITGNIPALFLSRQSISIFVRSFVKITCKCCLGSLLSELYCLSSVVWVLFLRSAVWILLYSYYLEPVVFRERIYYTCYKSTLQFYEKSDYALP